MKRIFGLLLTAALVAFASCDKNDATADYGFPKVYIPQATVTGLDNTYPIPLGPFYRNSTYSCSYENGILSIALGVIRSGYLAKQQAFSVDLGVSKADTDRKLAEYADAGTPAAALPQSVCTIPGKISVEEGTNGGTCKVLVDLKALAASRSSYYANGVYSLLVLGLQISNLTGPAEYTLADNYTSVVIVLDLGSSEWDDVAADKPESEVRKLFPFD